MFVTSVDERAHEVVYWIGSAEKSKQFGVLLPGPMNSHTDAQASSIAFAVRMANFAVRMADDMRAETGGD